MKPKIKITIMFSLLLFIVIFNIPAANIEQDVKISIVGDILLSRDVGKEIDNKGAYYPYENTKALLNKSEIVFGNFECPVTNGEIPALKKSILIFKTKEAYLPALKQAGINVLSLANNHTMDYGSRGMEDTLKSMDNNGIQAVGGGMNRESAHKPVYINKKGIKIGFMSYSTFPAEGHFFFKDKPDVAYVDEEIIGSEIKAAKEKCNWLIVSFHWGKEYSFYASENQKKLAHLVIDNGADMVVGQHPHVLQGIEKYKASFIFYSLGSFIFDNPIREGTTESMILSFQLNNRRIGNIELQPIKLKACQPYLCEGIEAKKILDNIKVYSKGFYDQIEIKNNKDFLR